MPRTKKEVVGEEKQPAEKKTPSKSKADAKNPRKIFGNINKVDGLDPSKLIKPYVNPLTGETTEDGFMPVKDRISWFKLVHPKGRIIPQTVSVTQDYVRSKAEIYIDNEPGSVPIAVATAVIEFKNPLYGGITAFHSAETCAVGRALAFAGFGTQAPGDELDTPIIDAGEPLSKTLKTEEGISLDVIEDKEDEVENKSETEENLINEDVSTKEELQPFEVVQGVEQHSEEKVAEGSSLLTKEEYEKKVDYILKEEMSGSVAGGTIICYGDLINKTVKDAFIELRDMGKDPIEVLKEYVTPKEFKPEYVLVSAACTYYINEYNKKTQSK